MFETLKYRGVRKAAEKAVDTIALQVPTINTWGDAYNIVAPVALASFWKLVSDDSLILQYQTPPGESPYRFTEVRKSGAELTITENVRGEENTTIVFVDGKFEEASTWDPVKRVKLNKARRQNICRIKKTLSPGK